jgi:hypothetical protein
MIDVKLISHNYRRLAACLCVDGADADLEADSGTPSSTSGLP